MKNTTSPARYAPVVVFAFNRPAQLERTLTALAANTLAAATSVHVFVDGPRRREDVPKVVACVKAAEGRWPFATMKTTVRENNLGLANSIIRGVSTTLATHERIIVVEDDLVTSPYFLQYMNDGLETYADEKQVAEIHGWCFPHAVANPPETFFLRGADCWGWGTWRRAWRCFEPDSIKLLAQLKVTGQENAFNLDGTYPYTQMLKDQAAGKVNSWAIRWHAAAFLHGMHTLYPSRSLVENIGMDGSGTHCGATNLFTTQLADTPVAVTRLPVQENQQMREAFKKFYGASG